MAGLGDLGTLTVNIGVAGLEVIQKAFADISASMTKVANTAAQTGQQMASGLAKAATVVPGLTTGLKGLAAVWAGLGLTKNPFNLKELSWTGTGLVQGFQGASQAAQGFSQALAPVYDRLHGMVMQGINASHYGEILSWRFAELNRQMAAIFVPTVQAVTQRLTDLVAWFRNLSGTQQAGLRFWGLFAVGISTTAIILPRVIASVQALGVAIKGIGVIMTGLALTNPWLLVIAGIGVAIAAVALFANRMAGAGRAGAGVAEAGAKLSDAFGAAADAAGKVADSMAVAASSTAEALRQALGLADAYGAQGQKLTGFAGIWGNIRDKQDKFIERFTSEGSRTRGFLSYFLGGTNPGAAFFDVYFGRTKPGGDRSNVLPALGGWESTDQTWRRIAAATRKVGGGVGGRNPQEESAEYLKKIWETVEQLGKKELRPPLGR